MSYTSFDFPHTHFYEDDLRELLHIMYKMKSTLENFIVLNTIKYANPIQWNITKQYESNTVVIDPNDGTAYLSVKPVPTGVAITNTDYWTPIFTLNLLSANQNITFRDDGSNVLATFESDAGDWLIWNNLLYKVSQHINTNEAYVEGYNIERYSVELFLNDAINAVQAQIDIINNTTIPNIQNTIITNYNSYLGSKWYVTPEEYGAVGDGVTDDTQAIFDCIVDANSKQKTVVLQSLYKITKVDLSNEGEISDGVNRMHHVHIMGNDCSFVGSKRIGFVSDTNDYAIVFPILHYPILENFYIEVPNGAYAFYFNGGLHNLVKGINTGYTGRLCYIKTGGYWQFYKCSCNTYDVNWVTLAGDGISATEYYLFLDCSIAHYFNTSSDYAGDAFITNGNNYTVFLHCDVMGWNNCWYNTGTRNAKALKYIDSQLGANHILAGATANGCNGVEITNCSIHVLHEYLNFTVVNPTIAALIFCNNNIFTTPTLTDKNVLLPCESIGKDTWRIFNNAYYDIDNMPPLTDLTIASGKRPANVSNSKYTFNSISAADITSGFTKTIRLEHLLTNGSNISIRAYATPYSSHDTIELNCSYAATGDTNTINVTMQGTPLVNVIHHVRVIVEY